MTARRVDSHQVSEARGERLLVVPLALWVVHVSVGYAIAGLNCHRHYFDATIFGVEVVRAVFVVASLAAAAVVAVVGARAALAWRDVRDDETADPTGRHAFVYGLTALVSAVALVYLTWASVFPFLEDTCG